MGMLKTTRTFPYTPTSLAAVAEQVGVAFRARGYEATAKETAGGGQFISLTKGDTFKAVLGLKTALNVQMNPTPSGTEATAEVGTYGEQFVGTAIAWLVFWPIAAVQVWGLIQNGKMDEQVMEEIEKALKAQANGSTAGASGIEADGSPASGGMASADTTSAAAKTCTQCGATLPEGAKFCLQCGTPVAA